MTLPLFSPSSEQSAIYTRLSDPLGGNILVSACPGSGKTTLCMNAFEWCHRDSNSFTPITISYLVFARRNADEARAKMATRLGVEVPKNGIFAFKNNKGQPVQLFIGTCHSFGLKALKSSGLLDPKRVNARDLVDTRKVPKLVWSMLDRDDPDVQVSIKLVGLLKGTCWSGGEADDVGPSLCRDLVTRYDLDCANEGRVVATALKALAKSTTDRKTIDYDDMLYMSVVLNATFAPQDYVFVDEAQDTNDVQVEILARLAKPNKCQLRTFDLQKGLNDFLPSPTRFIAVGDPFQAVYGFRGANSDAMDKIKRRFGMTTLPLSVSYRCPQKVVMEAQRVLQSYK